MRIPYRKCVYFYDPEGNVWEFVQYLSQDPAERSDYKLAIWRIDRTSSKVTYAASKRWARDDSEPGADAWPTVKKTYDAVAAGLLTTKIDFLL
jgi:hypothetical protein